MIKKILPLLFLLAIGFAALFSCKKVHKPSGDQTVNYFPIKMGNTITYFVDSIYWNEDVCDSYNVQSYMKYAITDTFRDSLYRLSYIMDVYTSPGGIDVFQSPDADQTWTPIREIYLTPLTEGTAPGDIITTGILYSQDGNQYEKLSFPIVNGNTWQGNSLIEPNVANQWLLNWTYTYSNLHLSYTLPSGPTLGNTVTVLEDNEQYNYLQVDSQVYSYRTYAEEIYAYNVGMVYKQWTHWTHNNGDSTTCKNGYQVIMSAVDYHTN